MTKKFIRKAAEGQIVTIDGSQVSFPNPLEVRDGEVGPDWVCMTTIRFRAAEMYGATVPPYGISNKDLFVRICTLMQIPKEKTKHWHGLTKRTYQFFHRGDVEKIMLWLKANPTGVPVNPVPGAPGIALTQEVDSAVMAITEPPAPTLPPQETEVVQEQQSPQQEDKAAALESGRRAMQLLVEESVRKVFAEEMAKLKPVPEEDLLKRQLSAANDTLAQARAENARLRAELDERDAVIAELQTRQKAHADPVALSLHDSLIVNVPEVTTEPRKSFFQRLFG